MGAPRVSAAITHSRSENTFFKLRFSFMVITIPDVSLSQPPFSALSVRAVGFSLIFV